MTDTAPAAQAGNKLRQYLWDACEVEQQLMILYLYAAFTLKNHPDESCTPAEWEAVRRWGSAILTVARGEMEHLALANGILTSIGQQPFFARENIPIQSRYFLGGERARDHSPSLLAAGKPPAQTHKPCDIRFVFERFGLSAISRFVCAESPAWEILEKMPDIPRADWCFGTPDHPCRPSTLADWEHGALRADAGGERIPLARTHVYGEGGPLQAGSAGEVAVHPGSIQELYERISRGLEAGSPGIFTGNPSQQVFVPVEYQINVTPVTDLASALLAIELIVEEGEGIDAQPDYQSHYRRFYDVRDELLALQAAAEREGRRFDPSMPVIRDPTAEKIQVKYTREVFELFNEAYVTLLFVLTSLYRNFDANESSYPFLSQALQVVAFGPFMTMILRPIAEVLVELKVMEDGKETAGPGFHLTPRDELVLWPPPPAPAPQGSHATPEERQRLSAQLNDIEFHLHRLEGVAARLEKLSSCDALPSALLYGDREAWARRKLAFVHESAQAMANSMRRVYQVGQLPAFVVT